MAKARRTSQYNALKEGLKKQRQRVRAGEDNKENIENFRIQDLEAKKQQNWQASNQAQEMQRRVRQQEKLQERAKEKTQAMSRALQGSHASKMLSQVKSRENKKEVDETEQDWNEEETKRASRNRASQNRGPQKRTPPPLPKRDIDETPRAAVPPPPLPRDVSDEEVRALLGKNATDKNVARQKHMSFKSTPPKKEKALTTAEEALTDRINEPKRKAGAIFRGEIEQFFLILEKFGTKKKIEKLKPEHRDKVENAYHKIVEGQQQKSNKETVSLLEKFKSIFSSKKRPRP